MEVEPHLKALHEWFKSDEAWLLCKVYERWHKVGTSGILSHNIPKPNVMSDYGVLKPEYFSQYMLEFKDQVDAAMHDSGRLSLTGRDLTLPLLYSTLMQMHDSVDFPKTEIAEGKSIGTLFAQGKRMANELSAHARDTNQTIQSIFGERRSGL